MTAIRREEWLRELEEIAQTFDDPDGMTVSEMASSSGHSPEYIRRLLRKGIDAGAWQVDGKKRIQTIDGRPTYAPCYRPVRGKDEDDPDLRTR